MLKIRRPLGRLIFNMGIAIPGKTVFLIETAPLILFFQTVLIFFDKQLIGLTSHLIGELIIRLNKPDVPLIFTCLFSSDCLSSFCTFPDKPLIKSSNLVGPLITGFPWIGWLMVTLHWIPATFWPLICQAAKKFEEYVYGKGEHSSTRRQ